MAVPEVLGARRHGRRVMLLDHNGDPHQGRDEVLALQRMRARQLHTRGRSADNEGGVKVITEDQLSLLSDVFSELRMWGDENVRAKLSIELDSATRTLTIRYWDFDDEDFREFQRLEGK